MDAHRIAEERSLALHAEVALRLQDDPRLLEVAREHVQRQLAAGRGVWYAEAWRDLLDGPLQDLVAVLHDPGEHGRAMRQATPFAGIVRPRRRWQIWREVRQRCEAQP